MISIDRLYKTILKLANSDIRGNVTPEEVRLFIYDAVMEIYNGYFVEVTRLVNRQNRGLVNGGVENIAERVREKLLYYLVEDETLTYAAPYFTIPTTVMFLESASYAGAEIEFCKSKREFTYVSNYVDTAPSATQPIGLRVGQALKVAPSTIVTGVKLSYLRKPLLPNWTYTIVNNAELFNPSAEDFADIDMHPAEEPVIVLAVLKRMGINLNDQPVLAYAQGQENNEFNQDNAM